MINPWLAQTDFVVIFPDGRRQNVCFRVGIPYRTEEPGEWACAVELEGLVPSDPDTTGSDAMQALCLALSWAGRELRDLNESGADLVERGSSVPFYWDDYFDLELAADEPE